MSKERWEYIPFTKNGYQVSNFGNVRSWVKKGGRRFKGMAKTPALLSVSINSGGYPQISVAQCEIGKPKTYRIHRLVAETFIKNPNNYPVVLHIDDNKLNCHYTNLKWGTSADNNRDAFLKGIIVPAKGEARKKSKLTNKDVMDIFKSKDTCRALAKHYKVNHTCIVDIRSGRSWNHITGLPCTRKIKPKFSKDTVFKDDLLLTPPN